MYWLARERRIAISNIGLFHVELITVEEGLGFLSAASGIGIGPIQKTSIHERFKGRLPPFVEPVQANSSPACQPPAYKKTDLLQVGF
ncbi:hypothetical protein B0A91_17530 [Pseudomonas syringae]|nr:hypothetical protein B1F67_16840 [Pseudomonas syringae]RXU19891.1 hypothetical protein B0A91_17530 [Pseudomonas syringae]